MALTKRNSYKEWIYRGRFSVKIVYVSDSIYPYNKGGKEKRLYEISTRIAKLGHDVHIYTMHWWDSSEKSIKQDGMTLHAISKKHEMYTGNRRSIKQGIFFGLACFRLLRVKFDVIDVDSMPFFPIYSTWVVCKLRRRKLYGTWHEALSKKDWQEYMGNLGIVSYFVEKISIKLPDHITVISPHTIKNLARYHGRSKNVSLIPPGIDFEKLAKIKPSKNKVDILYTGRLVKDKNIDVLVEAVGVLAKHNKNIKCLIIGHGIEKGNIKKLIIKRKLEKNIELLEPLSSSVDIYAQMKSSKVFALPSVREGFGMVALEALGCGTPVITTSAEANAAKDLVINGKNGSVIPLGIENLANILSKWIDTKPKDIAKSVSGEYDWNILAAQQMEVYVS